MKVFISSVITLLISLQQVAESRQESSTTTASYIRTVTEVYSTEPSTTFTSNTTSIYNLNLTSFAKSVTTETEAIPKTWPTNVNCDFNGYVKPKCFWTNARAAEKLDDFDWKHGRGKDAHKRKGGQKTGVKADSSGNSFGGYMYIRASKQSRLTKFFSPTISTDFEGCFQFWFHMSGRNTGHLQVAILPSRNHSNEKVLWKLRGSQSVRWQAASIPIPKMDEFVISFEGSDLPSGRLGNIAIDDITFVKVAHSLVCEKTPFFAFLNLPDATITMTMPTLSSTKLAVRSDASSTIPQTDTSSTLKNILKLTTEVTTNKNQTYPTTHPGSSSKAKLVISMSILGSFLILVVAVVCCVRYRRQRQFNYYDNCTVAMTRMSPDIVISNDNNKIEYQKLNQS